MKKLNEELEEVIDKYIKNPPKTSDEVVEIVHNCAKHFGGTEQALFICLIALGHSLKHNAEICKNLDDKSYFINVMGDPMIKMIYPFVNQILTCKRLKWDKEKE